MSNSERILRAIGEIDERYIEEAERYNKAAHIRKRIAAISAGAAAAAAIGFGVFALRGGFSGVGTTSSEMSSEISNSCEIAVIPRWDEMTIVQQFHELEYNGFRYSGNSHAEGYTRGEPLGTFDLKGYDDYEEKEYFTTAELYTLEGISSECAVVVEFEQGSEYVYQNAYYKPETLGDFIGALNLRENLEIVGAYREENSKIGWRNTTYSGFSTEKLFEILFEDESIKNVENYDQAMYEFGRKSIGFAINIPKIGSRNISIAVTEKGWLTTNILMTGKGFYLGEEKLAELTEYLESCEKQVTEHFYENVDNNLPEEEPSVEAPIEGSMEAPIEGSMEEACSMSVSVAPEIYSE